MRDKGDVKTTVGPIGLATAPAARVGAVEALDLDPFTLAELLLGAPVTDLATSTSLEPHGGHHLLSLRRGQVVVGAFLVDDDAAAAAVVRVALMTELDPLPAVGVRSNVARVHVEDDGRQVDALVSISARSAGFDVEVRTLLVDGREPGGVSRAALTRCTVCDLVQAGYVTRCERDGAAVEEVVDSPRPGGTIGPYRIGDRLGSGGMGAVYAATHALLDRPAAIKLMHRTAGDPDSEQRFLLEARLASRLRHPRIIDILDFGVLHDGRPYMVMERLHGRSLEALLQERGALSVPYAMRLGICIAEALGAAHDGGVVHNDLKPSNILLLSDDEGARRPDLKLIDFGAAVHLRPGGSAQEVIGTPAYISPERLRGSTGDGRSDLYSLGVVLYELVSGATPFDHADANQAFAAHLHEEPPPLTTSGGTPPRAVAQVVARALRKDPGERYQTAAEMIVDLESAVAAAERPGWRRWLP